jgi:hypothetical protein
MAFVFQERYESMKPIRSYLVGLILPAIFSLAGEPRRAQAADTALRDSDAAMRLMETPVKPEVLADFEKAHPAPYWLFGEDRQRAVRNNIIPAHWFENHAQSWNKFSGVARPGEFYVFQVCVLFGAKAVAVFPPEVQIPDVPGAEIFDVSRRLVSKPREVISYWIGIQVPANAKAGEYHGTAKAGDATLDLKLKVAGEPIAESGIGEGWRLARLKWLDSTVGESDTEVTRPFTPIRVNEKAKTLDILGRRITLGPDGIPAQYTSYYSGSNTTILAKGADAFASPPRLECVVGGKVEPWQGTGLKFTRQTQVGVEWEALSKPGDLSRLVRGRLEFDGHLHLQMHLASDVPVTVDEVRFVIPWAKDRVKYAMGIGLQGGKCPARHDWNWDVAKNQDAIWLGDVNQGLMLRFMGGNYRRPLINAYYDFRPLLLPDSWGCGGIHIENANGQVTLTAKSGKLRISDPMQPNSAPFRDCGDFEIDWYFTPFKPLNVHEHFTDRFYHAGQGAPVEDPAAIAKQGANIVEVHHNRLCNPYINYPYNDDSIGNLTRFVKKAHSAGVRVNVYYTTRELTQNLPEFFALKSLEGEVILPRRAGVAWPVTNPGGPHPWLKQHAGADIVPAWRENLHYPGYRSNLDLAVITTPDSRWNNFYLAGLVYLVKTVGIDGLYIDDTALDRKSMQRARRILDADGNMGRRMSMHSWNHFNGLAKWTNSSIAFMELYPYINGLWHGEGFNANAAPEYMLVEMSGIPFGLMSEMLDHPNPWHGLVFGMRVRWPWSGDPRNIWKAEDAFGIADAEFLGWWDAACPVQTGNTAIKASVFKRQGRAAIALASWAPQATQVKLAIDWKGLGLDPLKERLTAAEIPGFQPAAVFRPGDEIPAAPGKGWLLIVE